MRSDQSITHHRGHSISDIVEAIQTEVIERHIDGQRMIIDSVSHSSHYNAHVLVFTAIVVAHFEPIES